MASLIETDCSTPEPQTQQDILDIDSLLAPVRFSFLGSSSAVAATAAAVYSEVLFWS